MNTGALTMRDDAPSLPPFAIPALSLALLVAALLVLKSVLAPVVNQPVAAVTVDGQLNRLQAVEIVRATDAGIGLHLFDADLDAMRERIEALAWVSHARVSRQWPDTLNVRVTERVPYARWGEARMIDTDSRLFTPPFDQIPQDLPLLSAPPGHEAEAAAVFETLRMALASSAFVPGGLSLDARGEWRMTVAATAGTGAGIELRFGQDDPRSRVALVLGAVSSTLLPMLDQVAYVDLRYPNGFSVGWKNGVPPSIASGKSAARGLSQGVADGPNNDANPEISH
ncbi:FtsQ-type POTRA domain-containing protein [Nevskia sp.]|uniref:cell division protein FtsQ/DivIB n=1 Tax=Nevskia sp. TaxID=1929292 RepID=UPI0025F87000|nr:FtsQ-type POTRA domain-containing protein [Nevskia sp.]